MLSGHPETATSTLVFLSIYFCRHNSLSCMFFLIMNTSCVIKVSDLLRHPTTSDEISIHDCMIDSIPHLRAPGISASCRLQATNDGMIVVTLSAITARIDDICDLSGEDYVREVYVDSYEGRFSSEVVFHDDPDYVYEDDLPFLPDGESIDIQPLLTQAIVLQEPLVHIKPGKEYLRKEIGESEEENDTLSA